MLETRSLPPRLQALWVWYTAIAHSLVDATTWVAWADHVLERPGMPPVWVCQMSATRDRESLLRKLYCEGLEDYVIPGTYPDCPEIEIADHCLRWHRSEIPTSELVKNVFLETDPEDGPFTDLHAALCPYVERQDLGTNPALAPQIRVIINTCLWFTPLLLQMIASGDTPAAPLSSSSGNQM